MSKQTILDITVSPRSSKSRITIDQDNNIKIYLNSPPADGKANAECVLLISKKLHVAKSNILIQSGKKNKKKRLLIHGLSYGMVIKKLRGQE